MRDKKFNQLHRNSSQFVDAVRVAVACTQAISAQCSTAAYRGD
jgi:hypothetical protein